jgi:hypothetical protein
MKFRYYVTNLFEGRIEGTNDAENAENFAQSEDFFVVDTETGEWLTSDGRKQVKGIGD